MTVLAILGPTASGKSDLALRVAREFEGEVLSVDSMQVYRGMDIGTAKASPSDRAAVPHHLVDIADPSHDYSVSEFQAAGKAALEKVAARGRMAIVAGGSGLHFRSLVDPLVFPPTDEETREELERLDSKTLRERLLALDPAAGAHVDLANPRRVVRALEIAALTGATPSERAATPEAVAVRDYVPAVPFMAIGVDPGDDVRTRIERRFDAMLESGLLGEVEALEPVMGRVARQAVGYKELIDVLRGRASMEAGRAAAIRATTSLAKRQRTFFRRDPRIEWLDESTETTAAFETVCAMIARHGEG